MPVLRCPEKTQNAAIYASTVSKQIRLKSEYARMIIAIKAPLRGRSSMLRGRLLLRLITFLLVVFPLTRASESFVDAVQRLPGCARVCA